LSSLYAVWATITVEAVVPEVCGRSDGWVNCTDHRYSTRRMPGRSRSRAGLERFGDRIGSLTVGGFGLFCAGYDGNCASTPRNGYVTTYPSGMSIRREKAWA
jgi:hypothetical protein